MPNLEEAREWELEGHFMQFECGSVESVSETKQDAIGLLDGYKSFVCPQPPPSFLFVGNRLHSASLTFPEFQRADSNNWWSGKGGDAERRGKQSRNNKAVMRQGPDSPSRNIPNGYTFGSSAGIEAPRKRTATLGWAPDSWNLTLLLHHQPIRRKSAHSIR